MNVVCYTGRGHCDGPISRPEESYLMCVSLSVIRCNNNLLHLQRVGRRGPTKNNIKMDLQEIGWGEGVVDWIWL